MPHNCIPCGEQTAKISRDDFVSDPFEHLSRNKLLHLTWSPGLRSLTIRFYAVLFKLVSITGSLLASCMLYSDLNHLKTHGVNY